MVYSVVNIILSVTFISTFIGVFFFTYGNKVEKTIVKNQSEFLASELSRDIKMLLPTDIRKKVIEKMVQPNMQNQDILAEEYNNQLRKNAIIVFISIFIIGMIISWVLCQWNQINFYSIVQYNLIILCFIAITEFMFITFIIQNIIIADPKYVRTYLLSTIQKNFPNTLI